MVVAYDSRLADEIVIGFAAPDGNLLRLCGEYQGKKATFDGNPATIGLMKRQPEVN